MKGWETTLGWIAGGIYFCAVFCGVFGAQWLFPIVLVAGVLYLAFNWQAEKGTLAIKLGVGRHAPRDLDHGQRCPLCHSDFEAGDLAEACGACDTTYHLACREEWSECATLGCRSRSRKAKPTPVRFQVRGLSPKAQAPSGETPGPRRQIRISAHPISGRLSVEESRPAA